MVKMKKAQQDFAGVVRQPCRQLRRRDN